MSEYKSIPSILLNEAGEHFGEAPNVVRAVDFFRHEKPRLIRKMVKEFDAGINELNKERTEVPYTEVYGNVILLNHMIGDKPLPTLKDLAVQSPQDNPELPHFTIEEIQRKINSHEWEFPHSVEDPEQLAAGLLIEGYGLDMVRQFKREEVARQFVLAFEEVLYANFGLRHNFLREAVVPWMVEERDDFSPILRQELDLLTHVPRTLKEQMESLPTDEELQFGAASFAQEIRDSLKANHHHNVEVSARAKKRERIMEKAGDKQDWERRKALPDLIAARIITHDDFRVSNNLSWHWSHLPRTIWGRLTRKYIPGDGKHLINANSDPEYQGLHNYVIYKDPHGLYHIAEIQIMTPKQYEIYKRTRPGYEERRSKRKK